MEQEPYRSARRVFWIVDNGSSHRGARSIRRLAKAYRQAILVHTPVHASWLNQVEIYFSLVQRKVLTPNDFASLAEVEQRLRKAGAEDAVIRATLERLERIGFVDDVAFAGWWVEQRDRHAPRGRAALETELRAREIAAAEAIEKENA